MPTNNNYEISRGKTLIKVPHEDSTIEFNYKPHGPSSYYNINLSTLRDGARPRMAQLVSLLYTVYSSGQNEPEFSAIKSSMERGLLWAFTGLLYVPSKGFYIEDIPKLPNQLPLMNESELVKKLEKNDDSVRFVPFGFNTGEQLPKELAKNHYIVGLAGEEGAEKLAEISYMFKDKPCLNTYFSGHQNTRVSGLCIQTWPGHQNFSIFCNLSGISEYGCAFAMKPIKGLSL